MVKLLEVTSVASFFIAQHAGVPCLVIAECTAKFAHKHFLQTGIFQVKQVQQDVVFKKAMRKFSNFGILVASRAPSGT